MKFLLDTNALSEPQRPAPDERYTDWLKAQRRPDLAISVLTFGEIRRGAMRMAQGRRRAEIDGWIARFTSEFGERILPVDIRIANVWADISVGLQQRGRAIGLIDQLIAATAIAHGFTVVTRNVRDFEPTGCDILCPWSAS